jgi:hypothetical protein
MFNHADQVHFKAQKGKKAGRVNALEESGESTLFLQHAA